MTSISGGEGTVMVCSVCQSRNVQTLHLYWLCENGERCEGGIPSIPMPEYAGEAGLYPDTTFCQDCEAEGRHPHPPLERKPG